VHRNYTGIIPDNAEMLQDWDAVAGDDFAEAGEDGFEFRDGKSEGIHLI
jgi:hypothetical protein